MSSRDFKQVISESKCCALAWPTFSLLLQEFAGQNVLDILMLATKAKRASGMMTRATFLLNKEKKICYSAVFPR